MLHSLERAVSLKVTAALFLTLPLATWAEVSDKEPSTAHIWLVGFLAALLCFAGVRYRRWLAPVLAALPAFWFVSLLVEIHSPDVGPHLYAEQGPLYYVQAYLSLGLFVSGVILGWRLNRRRRET
ncbi:hypothetical protein [Azohydromonas caseinilytica]|uniref:Transmembrane protein n=1 Tax=Azohydromonas caseinilytica TaxID=2728836 RepID=A0A848FAP9_9BURK|nr:hypothetical protein [Azohydromonas caseinilytica]NML15946.1 hypothetical protein [Azohydromonas caseinilytica]